MSVQHGTNQHNQVSTFTIMPLNEVSVYLNGEDIEAEVCNVAMKKKTNYDSPYLMVVSQFGIVFVLQ